MTTKKPTKPPKVIVPEAPKPAPKPAAITYGRHGVDELVVTLGPPLALCLACGNPKDGVCAACGN